MESSKERISRQEIILHEPAPSKYLYQQYELHEPPPSNEVIDSIPRKRSRQDTASSGQPSKKLVQEITFNPLDEEEDSSESDYEPADATDDESLQGHNEEWLLASKRS
jgi:hypothetical protein